MRRLLQILALVVVLGTTVTWVSTGAHRGWTQTRVPRKTVDEVTGIEGVTYDRRFVMGLELLGAGWVGAGILAGGAFLFRKQTTNKTNTNND